MIPSRLTPAKKTPGLRNAALTAPYFHNFRNGGQSTLEQVVEFYDRGGDFPLASDAPKCPATTSLINCLMAPNVQPLGLTQQEKIDLVDFLRNGLLDSRTLNQMATLIIRRSWRPKALQWTPTDIPCLTPTGPGSRWTSI
jgi:hypothetical protein